MDKKQQLERVNKEFDELTNLLILSLQQHGIEYIDLNKFVTLKDTLDIKKNKILFESVL